MACTKTEFFIHMDRYNKVTVDWDEFQIKNSVKFIISSDVTFNVFIDNGNSVVKISKSYAISVNNDIKMDITSMDWE